MSSEFSPSAIGRRLRFLRETKGFKHQTLMAKLMVVSQSRYSNWENGIGVIPVEFAIKMCGLTGATLDFIYTGNRSSLPMHLLSAFNDAPAGLLGKVDE